MTIFWALSSLMVIAAIALVVLPLQGKRRGTGAAGTSASVEIHRHRAAELDEEHARGIVGKESLEIARSELKRELLKDSDAHETVRATLVGARRAVFATVIVVPVTIVGLYLWLGNAGLTDKHLLEQSDAGNGSPGQAAVLPEMHGVAEMIARLEEKLKNAPGDAEGWILLGRSYAYQRRFEDALRAFTVAVDLKPGDARLLSDYAEALAVTRNSRVDGEVLGVVQRALAINPDNKKALWLAGLERYQSGDQARAVTIWKRLQRQLPENSSERQLVDTYIAQAGGKPANTQATMQQASAAGQSAVSGDGAPVAITVHVALDPELAQQVSPDDTLFIFARAHDGPRMPLAIVRKQARELPLQVTLDDSRSMAPGMQISQFPRVVVGARISKRGDARAQAGDLEGLSEPMQTGSGRTARIQIDQVVQ